MDPWPNPAGLFFALTLGFIVQAPRGHWAGEGGMNEPLAASINDCVSGIKSCSQHTHKSPIILLLKGIPVSPH